MQFTKTISIAVMATLFSYAAAGPAPNAAKLQATANELTKRMQEPAGAQCNVPGRPSDGAYACSGQSVTECVGSAFEVINTCGPGQTCVFNNGGPVCGAS